MPDILLKINTDDPSELSANITFLEELRDRRASLPVPPTGPSKEINLHSKLTELLAPTTPGDRRRHGGYGPNRRAYVGAVAKQALCAPHDEVVAAVAAADPANPDKDHGRAIGGTHSSIEAGWQGLGLAGATWRGRTLPNQWITYWPDRRVHTMDPEVAQETLAVLAEIEASPQD